MFLFTCVVFGRPTIYESNRQFILEGDFERIKDKRDGSVYTQCHIHLFSDTLIISNKSTLGFYRLKKSFNLYLVRAKIMESVEIVNAFTIHVLKNGASDANCDVEDSLFNFDEDNTDVFHFRCVGKDKNSEWVEAIQTQVFKYNAKANNVNESTRERKRSSVVMISRKANAAFLNSQQSFRSSSSVMDNNGSNLNSAQPISGVTSEKLGPRSKAAFDFILQLQAEVTRLSQFNSIAIQPLIEASKGAALKVGSSLDDSKMPYNRESMIAVDTNIRGGTGVLAALGSYSNQREIQSVMEVLKFSDMQIFLRACEGLTNALNEFVMSLETNAIAVGWDDNKFVFGSLFCSQQANLLYQRYVSFASGKLAAIRILQDSILSKFVQEVNDILLLAPKHLDVRDTVIDILNVPQQFLDFLTQYADITKHQYNPNNTQEKVDEDDDNMRNSIAQIKDILTTIQQVLDEKQNFEKMLSIQKSIVILNLFPDTVVQNLVTNSRKFLLEDDLTKVCRKKNKEFRFWLFNDYLIYGNAIIASGGKYQLNRSIDLSLCTVEVDTSLGKGTKALQLLGAEKSFVLICNSDFQLEKWMTALSSAISTIKKMKNIDSGATGGETGTAAPIWVPDAVGTVCCVCETVSEVNNAIVDLLLYLKLDKN